MRGSVIYPVLSNAMWGSNFVVGRFLAMLGVDPVTLTLTRFAVAAPILAALVRFRVRLDRWTVLAGLFGIALFNLSLYAALNYISAGAAALLVIMSYPMTYLFLLAMRVERPRAAPIAGIALSMVGAYLVLRPYIEVRALVGPVLGLISAASWSAYTLVVRRAVAASGPVEVLASATVAGLLEMSPLVLAANPVDDLVELLLIIYVAVVPGVAAYSTWNIGVARLGPRVSSATLPLLPLFATLFSWIFLGEAMTAIQLLGAALVLAGFAASIK